MLENTAYEKEAGEGLYEFTAGPLLQRQAELESSARSYPRRIPISIKKAQGLYLEDGEGREFIDCLSGAGTLALGHNHPVIIDAIKTFLETQTPLHTLDLTTEIKDQFMQDILSSLPASFANNSRIQFCGPSGADAIEAAIKLVKTATGRSDIYSFSGGYHGMTHGALALTGNLGPKKQVPNLMSGVHFLPFPYDYRCPFGLKNKAGVDVGLHYIEHLLDDPESGILPPAAIFVEPVQGEGGVIPAPVKWLKELRRITRERNIPLILDEVQAGVGRTGKMYGFEHAGIEPDAVVISKAIGGSLPMSILVYKNDLDKWSGGAHTGTFRGNQMAMATGSATLKFIRENNLCENAEKMGERFKTRLRELQCSTKCIGEVRGKGLMLGCEIVDFTTQPNAIGSYPVNGQLAKDIQQACLKRGLILEVGGRGGCVVRFLPPLTITAEQVDSIIEIFSSAVLSSQAEFLENQPKEKNIA
jgi:diaminobutyrate-2-oxoglutarate transaminase